MMYLREGHQQYVLAAGRGDLDTVRIDEAAVAAVDDPALEAAVGATVTSWSAKCSDALRGRPESSPIEDVRRG